MHRWRELECLRPRFDFQLSVVDVDRDPVLQRRYAGDVPVLAAGGRILCRYHLDRDVLLDYLSGGEGAPSQ